MPTGGIHSRSGAYDRDRGDQARADTSTPVVLAPGCTLGRRLTVSLNRDSKQTFRMPTLPGDYVGPVDTDHGPAVFFLKPNAHDPDVPLRARSVQHVCSPPHVFTEMPDGSLQIRESISNLAGGRHDDGWHGYLDAGHVWRQV